MKKTFLVRRNAWLSAPGLSAGVAALILAGLFLLLRLFFPGLLVTVAAPFVQVGDSLAETLRTMELSVSSTRSLITEETVLENANAKLANENTTLSAKVADLERLLGGESANEPGMVAGVLARPPESPYDTLILAAGSADGVVLDSRAYGPGGVPVGTVESVTEHSSRVTLFSAPGIALNAWVGKARTPLTLVGVGGGSYTARASHSSPIVEGDLVYIAGPGALPIGSVAHIAADPSSPLETLQIRASVNVFSLTWVEIRKSPSVSWPKLLVASTTAP